MFDNVKDNAGVKKDAEPEDTWTRKITFRRGAEKERDACARLLDARGKYLSFGCTRDGDPYVVAQFDDGVDWLAFQVATGMVDMKRVENVV